MMRTDPEVRQLEGAVGPRIDSEDGFLWAHLRDKGVREA